MILNPMKCLKICFLIFILSLLNAPIIWAENGEEESTRKLKYKFELGEEFLAKLKEAGVSEQTFGELENLQKKVFANEDDFKLELKNTIDKGLADQLGAQDLTMKRVNLFATEMASVFVIMVAFSFLVILFSQWAKINPEQFIRRIPGLDAISDAVGRCTEMGRPVLYVPGIDDMNNIQTIASMVILENVAKVIGEYESDLIVPIRPPFVVAVAEEMVKKGYLDAGRPDAYKPDNVRFISDEQFAYAAGVNGIMLRERPAANLLLGSFFAESLVIAETGVEAGAIQVAGTANEHQLPFFVAACDFTLIGEEIYAASAYLSKEPELVGSLKGSDWAKVGLSIIMIIGAIAETFGYHFITNLFTIR